MFRAQHLMPWIAAAVVGAAVLASGQAASAQDATAETPSEFDAMIELANRAYSEGNLEEAAQFFDSAYALEPKSNILYNLGRVYERLGRIQDAVVYYDKFLIAGEVDHQLRRDALERRKLLGEVIALRTKKAEPSKPVKATQAPEPVVVVAPETLKEEGPGFAPWVLVGAGGASIVASLVFTGMTSSYSDTFSDSSLTPTERSDAQSSGETSALLADVTMGLGVASVATGLVWYFVGSSEGNNTTTSRNSSGTLTPLIGDQAGGVVWTLDFQ